MRNDFQTKRPPPPAIFSSIFALSRFYFQTKWFYFQKDTRSPGPIFSPSLVSIYSRSYMILFLVHMRALYIVSLNDVFLEQQPAIFSSTFGLSSTKALTSYFQMNLCFKFYRPIFSSTKALSRFYFQFNRCFKQILFLVQYGLFLVHYQFYFQSNAVSIFSPISIFRGNIQVLVRSCIYRE